MGANPIDYPNAWIPTEFTCNCGTKCRVDVELSRWTEVGNFYQHCAKDEGQYFPGRIIATLEQRDGVWVRM
jgi:hypothetical protein